MKRIYYLIIIIFFTSSCKNKTQENYLISQTFESQTIQEEHPGKKLLEMYCYVCHNPTTVHDDRIAPPMIAVKKHYYTEDISKEEFIANMQSWIKNPTEENAKMRGAVRRFGLMPKAQYPENDIKLIAEYIYENKIEEPEWFADHFNKEHGQQGMGKGMGKGHGKGQGQGKQMHQGQNKQKSYSEIGLNVALSIKQQLGKNLMDKIQKKGTLEAVKFCNVKAYPLTDSMAVVHNASIKRVSDNPRNPNNKANAIEQSQIEAFKLFLKEDKEIRPITIEYDKTVQFYYPILTNSMCLQCHGKVDDDIKPEVYKTLKALYPQDKAIGYDINNVRGIWSITLNK